MSRDDDKTSGMNNPTPEAQKALEALMGLPRPRPSDQARQSARAAFLQGDQADHADQTSKEKPGSARPRRRSQTWSIIPLAAVLVGFCLLAVWYGMQPREHWIITDLVEPEGIMAHADELVPGAEVQAGCLVTDTASELELQLGQELRFRMLPASNVDLPPPPSRWFGDSRTLLLENGEIYGTTGGQSLSFSLLFETLEVTAQLTGTTFAVFRTDVGSCVCLWKGSVAVTQLDSGEAVTLQPETKFYVYNDGRPSEVQPIDDMERMKLSMMHDSGILTTQESP